MSTITRERIENLIEFNSEGSDCQANAEQWEVHELARIALASLEAEAECQHQWRLGGANKLQSQKQCVKCGRVELVASPAPVSVPDEMTPKQASRSYCGEVRGYRDGWNACRAAMLQGADERHVVRSEHAEWSQSTFGDVGPVGPLKHLSKEALEAAAEPEDLSEWADMQFLMWDAQRRAGITDEQITLAMIEKLAVNKSRTWPEPKDGEPRLHIKAEPQQEVK